MNPNRSLRIAVADDEPDMLMFFRELLPPLGHQVVAEASTGRELIDRSRETRPDLVITDIRMPDMDGVEAAAIVNREHQVPVVLVTAHPETDFLAHDDTGHVMAYLSKPVKPVDLLAAIRLATLRFEQFHHVTNEASTLRQALEDRKAIERAKGIVMKRLGLDENEAFRRLRKMASDRNHKLVEVAQQVVAADEPFHRMEAQWA